MLTAVVARGMGLEVLANLALAQSVVSYATVLSDGGLNNHAIRMLLHGTSVARVVSLTLKTQALMAIITVALIVVLGPIIAPSAQEFIWALVLVPIATALSTPYVLQARHVTWPVAFSRILGAVVTTVIGLCLVWMAALPWTLGLAYSAGAIGMALWVCRSSSVTFADVRGPVKLSEAAALLRQSAPLALYGLLLQVVTSLPLLMTQALHESESFEAMGLASRLWFIVTAPAAMAGSILIPVFADKHSAKGTFRRYLLIAVLSGSACALVFALLAPWVVPLLFGADSAPYWPAVVFFISGSAPFYVATIFICRSIAEGTYWVPAVGFALGGCVFIAMSFMLPSSAGVGAGLSWLASQIVLCAVVVFLILLGKRK
ncbi:hypothetical protein CHE218_01620 [Microbacterium sp. che218]